MSDSCNPMDCNPPGSSAHGILQARILEWVAMPFSRDLPHPGIQPMSLSLLHWQAGSLPLVPPGKPFLGLAREASPTPVLLPRKSHGRRGLVGCSPWGREESGTTERLHFHSSLSCIGEGNGSPLQYSCLENPRDGGALWAAI